MPSQDNTQSIFATLVAGAIGAVTLTQALKARREGHEARIAAKLKRTEKTAKRLHAEVANELLNTVNKEAHAKKFNEVLKQMTTRPLQGPQTQAEFLASKPTLIARIGNFFSSLRKSVSGIPDFIGKLVTRARNSVTGLLDGFKLSRVFAKARARANQAAIHNARVARRAHAEQNAFNIGNIFDIAEEQATEAAKIAEMQKANAILLNRTQIAIAANSKPVNTTAKSFIKNATRASVLLGFASIITPPLLQLAAGRSTPESAEDIFTRTSRTSHTLSM